MKRIELLDLWRTIAIVSMVVYHLLYDFALFGIIGWEQFFSPGLNAFQRFICCSFIIVSGISSRMSRNNVKRGAITLGASVIISVGGYIVGEPILFGVLSFLGCAMIIYGLFGKTIDRLPKYLAPVLFAALYFITKFWTESTIVSVKFLFPLGFLYPGFYSADYFPLMPWLFLFLLGTWLGGLITRQREAKWLYTPVPRALTFPGRHSLVIYMLHQPVLYGITMILTRF